MTRSLEPQLHDFVVLKTRLRNESVIFKRNCLVIAFNHQIDVLDSVPVNDYIRLEHRLNLSLSKNKILMEREKSWTEFKNRREIDLFKEQETNDKLRALESEVCENRASVLHYYQLIRFRSKRSNQRFQTYLKLL